MRGEIKTVVVSGQGRKVGKTAVICGLIRRLRSLGWTAVKISRHGGGVPHVAQPSLRAMSARSTFLLTEEKSPSRTTDTGRFLAAGARRALWLRVESGGLAKALPALWRALEGERNVLIESSGILRFMTPTVCLLVLDRSRRDVKAGTRRALARADAIVQVAAHSQAEGRSISIPPGVPVFTVTRSSFYNSQLCDFVRRKLRRNSNSQPKLVRRGRHVARAGRSRSVGTQQE